VLRLNRYERKEIENRRFHSNAVSLIQNISGRRGRPHQPFYHFVWYKNMDRSFFHFVKNHAFVRRTDGRTDRQADRQNSHR